MLHIAKENVQTAQDRARFYVDQDRRPRAFTIGKKVVLRVPTDSTSLSTSKCAKLAPRYCGPFEIIMRVRSSAYHLPLPCTVGIHHVFQSSVKRLDCTTTSHEEERINKDVVRVEGPTKRRRQEEKRLRDVQV